MRKLKLYNILVLLAALGILVSMPMSMSAGELSPTSKSKASSAGGYERLALLAAQNGSVRIIVKVEGSFPPMGGLSQSKADEQQRAMSAAQDKVIGRLSSLNVSSYYKYKYIPHIAMTVDSTALDALLSITEVSTVELDRLSHPTQVNWNISKVGAPAAWSAGYDGTGIAVAILDTGVDKTHPILTGKVVSEACYSTNDPSSAATSVCPGGVTESTASGSAMPYAGNCPTGECDHGTHVAGIAAGQNAGQSSGVAKGANIIAIQVFSRFDDKNACGGTSACAMSYDSDQIKGMERVYALINTYSTASVNMSLGGDGYSSYCDNQNTSVKAAIDTLRSAGVATVIAAGNDGYTNQISAPGCISTAVSVGATTSSDTVASYSNSANFLNLLAPGSSITSSVPNGGYQTWNGTSMATPHVAGAWAVLKQAKPSASVTDILSALTNAGISITDSRNNITKPRIQVDAALNSLINSNGNVTLNVLKSGTGTGTVTSNPAGISCGTTCSASYTAGATVVLTASADTGSSFTSWSNCDNTSAAQCTVTLSSTKSVTAVFTSSGNSNYSAASAWIKSVATQYASYFGNASGSVMTGSDSNGTYYVQWFTNGTGILAYSDGNMYYYGGTGSSWTSLALTWNDAIAAAAWINAFATQYSSYFGTSSGGVVSGANSSGTYYVEWFTNGKGLLAYSDGYVYFYTGIGNSWSPFSVLWKGMGGITPGGGGGGGGDH